MVVVELAFLAIEPATSVRHSRMSLSIGGDCCFHFRILQFDFLSAGVSHYAGQVLAIWLFAVLRQKEAILRTKVNLPNKKKTHIKAHPH